MTQKPQAIVGLRHVALFIKNFAECEYFYVDLLGMKIDWRPDEDNLYLTSGTDNLALHRARGDFQPQKPQRLDHIGFFLKTREDVDLWHEFLKSKNINIKKEPKDHRDGSRSFYCADPDGNIIQMLHFPINNQSFLNQ